MRQMLLGLLLGGALIGAVQSAAIMSPCDFAFTYYPPGRENTNVPDGWNLRNQKAAGNDATDEMLRIVLAGYPVPSLQVWPMHYLLDNDTEVPVTCWAPQSSATVQEGTRRLRQATRSEAYVIKPATYKVEYTLMARNRLAGISPNGSATSPPLSIKLEQFGQDVIPDGEYCMDIFVTIVAQTAIINADLNATQISLPTSDMQIKKRVCFLKMSIRPKADISFSSCNSTFSMRLANITPAPVYPDRAQVLPDKMLTKTVFHVWAKMNSTLPGAALSTDQNLQDYMDEFLALGTNKTDSIVWSTKALKDGIYTFKAEGSIATNIPELVSVAGQDTYPEDRADLGTIKYMGGMLQNATPYTVYVQNRLSRIYDVTGPATSLGIGDDATFTWDSDGYGEFFCYVDSKRVYNLVDKSHCESPITLKLKDTANHTLEVVMVDVCRKAIKKTILFGAWGWALNTTGEPPEPPPAAEAPPAEPIMMKQFNYTRKNAADMPAAQLLAYCLSALLMLLGLLA